MKEEENKNEEEEEEEVEEEITTAMQSCTRGPRQLFLSCVRGVLHFC